MWHLALPLAVGIGLIAALFYVQGTAKIIIRMALVGVVILCAQTILQGTWTERLRVRPVSEQEQALAARLKSVPFTVGNWDSDESKIDERGLEGSRTVGYYGRIFHNRDNPQQVVSVYVFCGHPRDMTQHTPDQVTRSTATTLPTISRSTWWMPAKCRPIFTRTVFTNRRRLRGLRKCACLELQQRWPLGRLAEIRVAQCPVFNKIYAITEVSGDTKSSPADTRRFRSCENFFRF